MTIKVKNWGEFQHYKDRNPPWIKLSTSLFQDYDFSNLDDASKLLAICIWTLASRSKDPKSGAVPSDLEWIKKQCGLGRNVSQKNLNELIDKGFIIDASKLLADCKQSARPETEAYSEEAYSEEAYSEEAYSEETEADYKSEFEEFWKSWISYKTGKGSKQDAKEQYLKIRKEINHETIMRSSTEYCNFCSATDCNTKNVFRWLQKRGWEDDHTIPTRAPANSGNAADSALRDRVNDTAGLIDSLCGDKVG